MQAMSLGVSVTGYKSFNVHKKAYRTSIQLKRHHYHFICFDCMIERLKLAS